MAGWIVVETAAHKLCLVAEELVVASLEDDECALADTDGESLRCDVITYVAPLIIERRKAEGKVHWCVALCVQEHLGADALRVLLARMRGALWASQTLQPGTCVLDGVVVMVPSCATAHSTACALRCGERSIVHPSCAHSPMEASKRQW